jgi:hypothetical protein
VWRAAFPLLAQIKVSWAWVKAVCRALGVGFGLLHTMLFMTLNSNRCSANPRLKMMWWVPLTQSVPSGLRTRRASRSHLTLNGCEDSATPSHTARP